MRISHKASAVAAAVVLAGTGLTAGASAALAGEGGAGGPASSQAAKKPTLGCDEKADDWFWGKITSVKEKGRVGTLYTERKDDDEAYTEGSGHLKKGDRIAVERSKKKFKMRNSVWSPSNKSAKSKGYKSCRNKIGKTEAGENYAYTKSVWHQTGDGKTSYAVRACVDPVKSKADCTKWYVDHK